MEGLTQLLADGLDGGASVFPVSKLSASDKVIGPSGGTKVSGLVGSGMSDPSKTTWASLFGHLSTVVDQLLFMLLMDINGTRIVVLTKDVLEEGVSIWACSLVG